MTGTGTETAAARRRSWRRTLMGLLPWLLLAYGATGLYSVKTNERALVRRFGRALPELRSPGLNLGLPYGLDTVTRVRVSERKRVGVGFSLADRTLGRQARPRRAEGLTGDRNLLLFPAVITYRIADPKAYLLNVADVPTLVRNTTAAALSSTVARMKVDAVLTVERDAIRHDVTAAVQARLDRLAAGVEVTWISLEGMAPPQEVADAFRDVASARGDRQRAINEARGYADRLEPQARGEAWRITVEAEAYAAEILGQARGDTDRFLKIAAAYSGAQAVTARRLILETLEIVLPRLKKVILDPAAHEGLDLQLIEADE